MHPLWTDINVLGGKQYRDLRWFPFITAFMAVSAQHLPPWHYRSRKSNALNTREMFDHTKNSEEDHSGVATTKYLFLVTKRRSRNG